MAWSCGVCTFENREPSRSCDVCGTARGVSRPEVAAAVDPAVLAAAASVATVDGPRHGLMAGGVPVPLQRVKVHVDVIDFVAKVEIEQHYVNQGGSAIEATYTFPADPKSTLNRFRVRVGERTIEGAVRDEAEARQTYRSARARGDGAFLVEEDKDAADVFKASVGNLRPGQTAVVLLSFVSEVPTEGPDLRFTLPTAVAPRYALAAFAAPDADADATADAAARGDDDAEAAAGVATDAVTGAATDLEAVASPSRLEVAVHFKLGSSAKGLVSPSHGDSPAFTATLGVDGDPRRAVARLCGGADAAGAGQGLDGDFVVLASQSQPFEPRVWVERLSLTADAEAEARRAAAAADGTAAAVAGARVTGGGGDAGASEPEAPADPTAADAEKKALPSAGAGGAGAAGGTVAADSLAVMVALYPDLAGMRVANDSACEFVFVVDRSGSMAGSRMASARNALQLCLRSLPETATFNIVGFGSTHQALFPEGSRRLTPESLAAATRHVGGMQANLGGTEILRPLQAVLADRPSPATRGRGGDPFAADPAAASELPRQVLLLTDGEVRDTRRVVDFVRSRHEQTGCRVFTLGIGREVSHHLVRGVAEAGGGHAEFIVPNAAGAGAGAGEGCGAAAAASSESLEAKVMRQLERALQPVLTELRVDWGDAWRRYTEPAAATTTNSGGSDDDKASELSTFAAPAQQLPLFTGTRACAFAIVPPSAPPTEVKLSAMGPDGPLSWSVLVDPRGGASSSGSSGSGGSGSSAEAPVPSAADAAAGGCMHTQGRMIHTAAARARIRDLEVAGDEVAAVRLATAFNVACRWASFVAVEKRSAADRAATLRERERARDARAPVSGAAAAAAAAAAVAGGDRIDAHSELRARELEQDRMLDELAESMQELHHIHADIGREAEEQGRALAAVERNVEGVRGTMSTSIDRALSRGDRMDELTARSSDLDLHARTFHRQAQKAGGGGVLSGIASGVSAVAGSIASGVGALGGLLSAPLGMAASTSTTEGGEFRYYRDEAAPAAPGSAARGSVISDAFAPTADSGPPSADTARTERFRAMPSTNGAGRGGRSGGSVTRSGSSRSSSSSASASSGAAPVPSMWGGSDAGGFGGSRHPAHSHAHSHAHAHGQGYAQQHHRQQGLHPAAAAPPAPPAPASAGSGYGGAYAAPPGAGYGYSYGYGKGFGGPAAAAAPAPAPASVDDLFGAAAAAPAPAPAAAAAGPAAAAPAPAVFAFGGAADAFMSAAPPASAAAAGDGGVGAFSDASSGSDDEDEAEADSGVDVEVESKHDGDASHAPKSKTKAKAGAKAAATAAATAAAEARGPLAAGESASAYARRLVLLADVSGSWQLTPDLASAVGLSMQACTARMPLQLRSLPDPGMAGHRMWATWLALAALERYAGDASAEWALVARKATRWLQRCMGRFVLDLPDMGPSDEAMRARMAQLAAEAARALQVPARG